MFKSQREKEKELKMKERMEKRELLRRIQSKEGKAEDEKEKIKMLLEKKKQEKL